MDYSDIMKIFSNGKANPDMTTMLSSLSAGGGDMGAILPVIMKAMQKQNADVSRSEEISDVSLPSEDELNAALLKLNDENKQG